MIIIFELISFKINLTNFSNSYLYQNADLTQKEISENKVLDGSNFVDFDFFSDFLEKKIDSKPIIDKELI